MFELIAMHKPVVISRTKAVESFFGSGSDCLKYFNSGDPGELAKCIVELHQDPDAVTSMTRNAFARYQAFSWKNTQHQYCRVVESGAPKENPFSCHGRHGADKGGGDGRPDRSDRHTGPGRVAH